MQAALAPRGDARTYLTNFVDDGLDDNRYVVETYRSPIARSSPYTPTGLGRRAGAMPSAGSCR